jgi:hypothetical protein
MAAVCVVANPTVMLRSPSPGTAATTMAKFHARGDLLRPGVQRAHADRGRTVSRLPLLRYSAISTTANTTAAAPIGIADPQDCGHVCPAPGRDNHIWSGRV